MNHPQTQLLPLHVLADSDILNVPDASKSTKELLLKEDGPSGHHSVGRLVHDGDHIVCLRFRVGREHGLEMGLVGLEARVRDLREHLQDFKVPALVVVDCKRPDLCSTPCQFLVRAQWNAARGVTGSEWELTAHMQVAV